MLDILKEDKALRGAMYWAISLLVTKSITTFIANVNGFVFTLFPAFYVLLYSIALILYLHEGALINQKSRDQNQSSLFFFSEKLFTRHNHYSPRQSIQTFAVTVKLIHKQTGSCQKTFIIFLPID